MTRVEEKDRWELLGGGEEPEDNGNLLKTAIRESHEEGMIIVQPEHTNHVGNLIQVIPGTGGKTGIVGVYHAQVFEPAGGYHWKDFHLYMGDQLAHNNESDGVRLIRFVDIFSEEAGLHVPLGHKRMILHMLNVQTQYFTIVAEGTRLGQPVTAEVPHLGMVTC